MKVTDRWDYHYWIRGSETADNALVANIVSIGIVSVVIALQMDFLNARMHLMNLAPTDMRVFVQALMRKPVI